MLTHFCTLFNSAYLSRGLALYRSLYNTSSNFHLYVFAFDEVTFDVLSALSLPFMTVIPLSQLEEAALLAVKSDRTLGEYCWTCTPASILYCLEHFKLPAVCYLDADLYFWQDPAILLNEMQNASVMLTEHRYTAQYDKTESAGKYCIQFMAFKNDVAGLKALHWWKAACIDWCYDRVEPGRFGDQKYCDDWLERFEGVVVLKHLGGGVAPWNVQQYEIACIQDAVPHLKQHTTDHIFPLVFYHFHALKFVNDTIDLGGYRLSQGIKKQVYAPYVKVLLDIEQELISNENLSGILQGVNMHHRLITKPSLSNAFKAIGRRLRGDRNVMAISEIA